jgi:hypothetical protein
MVRERDRAEGGDAKAEMMMELQGLFLAQSGDCLMRIDLPGLFDGYQFVALVAPIVHPLLQSSPRPFTKRYISHAAPSKSQDV